MKRAISPSVTTLPDLWRQTFAILRTGPFNFIDLWSQQFTRPKTVLRGFIKGSLENGDASIHHLRETSSSEEVFSINQVRRIAIKHSDAIDPYLCKRLLMLDLSLQWRPMRNLYEQAETLYQERKSVARTTKGVTESEVGLSNKTYIDNSPNALYSLVITIDGVILGTASLTGLTQRTKDRQKHSRQSDTGTTASAKKAQRQKKVEKAGVTLNAQAQSLLRLIVDYIRAATMMELRDKEIAHFRRRAQAGPQEEVRLKTSRVKPPDSETTMLRCMPQTKTHGEGLILIMLDDIHVHYSKPLTLKHFAEKLKLNPAYVCDLFAQCVGTSFKRYLTDVRINQAKVLLADPTCRISEISSRVGYSDSNRFRAAFKKETGLAPADWRQTWQPNLKT